ncbi:MAG: glycosyltransferase family 1 protein [Chloroflexi bacterium]|nr:MAG: glycosyltransferase family 1 protein [Chloroflexota bacterium]
MPDGHACLDLVLLFAPPWGGPTRFSKHHLATHFAERGARVLYVEAPLNPFGLKRGGAFAAELRASLQPPSIVLDRLWVRRHFVPVPYHAASRLTSHRAANRLAQRLLAPMVRHDLRRLGMRSPIVIAGLPHAVDLVPLVPRRALVYHCADDYAHIRGFPSSLPALEADLCRQADLVITTTETLRQARLHFNPNTHWVANGVDAEHFAQNMAPAGELRDVTRPIVGFVGGLSEWVDVRLLRELALARPDWAFALVGPIGVDVFPIRQLPNVRLLGPRPYASLPAYLAAMDVALIPFKREPVTYHADPIKAYEYLAAGLPTVATDLPALRRLKHVVRLADSPACFLHEIEAALAEDRAPRSAERRAEAARHTWTSRFERVDQLIREVLECAS